MFGSIFQLPSQPGYYLVRFIYDSKAERKALNAELCRKALEKVGNPNILVNLVSRRVRQLTTSGGASRPLIADTGSLGAGDIALLELIEDKMSWEHVEDLKTDSRGKRRRKG